MLVAALHGVGQSPARPAARTESASHLLHQPFVPGCRAGIGAASAVVQMQPLPHALMNRVSFSVRQCGYCGWYKVRMGEPFTRRNSPMHVSAPRLIPFIAAVLCLASSWASSQTGPTTIKLNRAAGGSCVVVTDDKGIALDTASGSSALTANGVQFTETVPGACSPAGVPRGPQPQTIVLAPPNSVDAGSTFAVTFSSMSDTTQCVGSGTLGGQPATNLGDWTTSWSYSGTSTRNVTVPVGAATPLVLTLKCEGAPGTTAAKGTSGAITVSPVSGEAACQETIDPGDGTGPRTRLLTSDISYGVPRRPDATSISPTGTISGAMRTRPRPVVRLRGRA